MSRTIAYSEPTSARAGDTWEWKKTISEFPADTWTLTYTIFNASAAISIVADADGTDYHVDVAPATTAAYTAGRYDWIAQVSDGTDTHQVGRGAIQILPDLSSVQSYDGRSHARKMLDYINAIMEGSASTKIIHAVRSDMNGRGIQYSVEALIKLRQQYASAVRSEDEALALANGRPTGRFITTRIVG